MAYNTFFPPTYQPYMQGYNPYYQQQQPQQAQMAQQPSHQVQNGQQMPQIQQSGFVLVQSEQEARAYPVAPGNSVTFKDERQPYCYVKTMGFNQLDRPTFEKYRLVKEDVPKDAPEPPTTGEKTEEDKLTEYATKHDVIEIMGELDVLKKKIKELSEKKPVKVRKIVEEEEDDE